MSNNRAFTFIETLIATLIMAAGLTGAAAIFSYSVRTNLFSEQVTTGVLLANTKMEAFHNSPKVTDFPVGGGLDASSPSPGYFEYISISPTGAVTADTVSTAAPYIRLWQITGSNPRLVTVSVHAQNSGISRLPIELVRTTTELTNGF